MTALRSVGRPPSVLSRVSDLEDEVSALECERADTAVELRALSRRIELAIHAERPDVALHVAGRLDHLAASMFRRGLTGGDAA